MFRKLNRLLRYVFKPNNRIKINTLERHWYHDIPNLILHANMALLCDFVENELPLDLCDWQADDECSKAYDIFMDIYSWWSFDPMAKGDSFLDKFYVQDDSRLTATPMPSEEIKIRFLSFVPGDEFWEREINSLPKNMDASCLLMKIESLAEIRRNEMLKNLIDVRGFLWT